MATLVGLVYYLTYNVVAGFSLDCAGPTGMFYSLNLGIVSCGIHDGYLLKATKLTPLFGEEALFKPSS